MTRAHSPSAHTHRAAGPAVLDLIERLEKAEAGSLALDAAILASLGFTWRGMNYWNAANVMWRGGTNPTRSLDAALALAERVLPGWHWHEITGPRTYLNIPTPVPNRWCAKLDDERGWGATPSLALCAAVLRATTPAEADAVGMERDSAECTQSQPTPEGREERS